MIVKKIAVIGLGAATVLSGLLAPPVYAQNEQFIPMLVYRTGPYAHAPSGIPAANGFRDYYTLINKRDGGINGVKIVFEECETQYNTKLGVECYEKLKNKGPTGASLVNPFSTGITYQLIPKAPVDKVPILSMGYGRTAAADGRVFEWVFNFPTTYWSQASAFIKYVGQQEGGLDKLKGKKIAHVYHNSAYGKEANPTLETLADKYGYELTLLAVDHPGQEQKATWLQIRQLRPDWIFMSGWGVIKSPSRKPRPSNTRWIISWVTGGLEVMRMSSPPARVPWVTSPRHSITQVRAFPSTKTSSSMSTMVTRLKLGRTISARCSTIALWLTPCSASKPYARPCRSSAISR